MFLTLPGSLRGTVRHADGEWTHLARALSPEGLRTAGGPRAVAATPDGDLQLLTYSDDHHLCHNIRFADGSWQGWRRFPDSVTDKSFSGGPIALTVTPNGNAHVLARDNNGGLQYNLRAKDGSWLGWQPVLLSAQNRTPFSPSDVAIAGMPSSSVRLFAYDIMGSLHTTDRWTALGQDTKAGVWDPTGWSAVPGAPTFPPVWATGKIAVTGMPDGTVQLAVAAPDGRAYHNLMHKDGSSYQDQGWAPVPGDSQGRLSATSVAITGMPDGSAQLVVNRDDATAWHVIRNAAGNWTAPDCLIAWFIPGVEPVPGAHIPSQSSPIRATGVAVAGFPSGDMYTLCSMK